MHDTAAAAIALARSHPHAPALDVLDWALRGHGAATVSPSAPFLHPASAFGQLVAAAFDRAMSPAEWRVVDAPTCDPALRVALLHVWRVEVLPLFASRFGVKVAG